MFKRRCRRRRNGGHFCRLNNRRLPFWPCKGFRYGLFDGLVCRTPRGWKLICTAETAKTRSINLFAAVGAMCSFYFRVERLRGLSDGLRNDLLSTRFCGLFYRLCNDLLCTFFCRRKLICTAEVAKASVVVNLFAAFATKHGFFCGTKWFGGMSNGLFRRSPRGSALIRTAEVAEKRTVCNPLPAFKTKHNDHLLIGFLNSYFSLPIFGNGAG